jgi:NAD(P)-dependent dehydrogenase (short-subunit alcohol dehydrogenase family)
VADPAAADAPLALVTGAARRVGLALAQALARRGYVIGLHYHRSLDAARAAALAMEAAGGKVALLPADLRDPVQIDTLFERVAELGHPLRVLVNAAAEMQRGDLRDLPVDAWDATLALNLRAPWLCAQRAARLMDAGGLIVNLTDTGANQTWTGFPAYTISKSGLETLTRLLAKALAPEIRVNAIAPGLILPAEDMPAEDWQRLVERLPLKRAGAPEDIVRALEYLLDSPYVTGQVIVVDGGRQLV